MHGSRRGLIACRSGTRASVGTVVNGLRELKIDHGPGYRVYYVERCSVVVVLLCGGDKRSQQCDIELAILLKKMLEEA